MRRPFFTYRLWWEFRYCGAYSRFFWWLYSTGFWHVPDGEYVWNGKWRFRK